MGKFEVFEGFVHDDGGFPLSIGYFVGHENAVKKYLDSKYAGLASGFPKMQRVETGVEVEGEEYKVTRVEKTGDKGERKLSIFTAKIITDDDSEGITVARELQRKSKSYLKLLEEDALLKRRLRENTTDLTQVKRELRKHLKRYEEIPHTGEIELILEGTNLKGLVKKLKE